MSELKQIRISSIDENPHRQLGTYPTIEAKVKALARSIEDVGMWEGVIARPKGRRYEMAFGHHRLEAAKAVGLTSIPVIVRDLSDEEMLKFMGRENGEDYSTQFLVMLNTWEGAVQFLGPGPGQKLQAIEIARLLGWTRPKSRGGDTLSHVASACHAAHALISGGHLDRSDLEELSVDAAESIVTRAQSRMEQIDKMAQKTKRPPKEVKQAKTHVAKGAKTTATQVRSGIVASRDVRGQVDVNSFKSAATSKAKATPLFAVFGDALAQQIGKMLAADKAAEKLGQVAAAINSITMQQDAATVRKLQFELAELKNRTEGWGARLTPTSEKVVRLASKALPHKKEA